MARQTQHDGDAASVQFVQLTVDPGRDTPARLAAYRQLFAPAPSNWSTLSGSASSIASVWKYFGVGYTKVAEDSDGAKDWWTGKPLTYDVQHTDAVAFLDGQQHERFLIVGAPNTAGSQPPSTLKHFLSAEGRTNLNHPDLASTWTVKQGLGVLAWVKSLGE